MEAVIKKYIILLNVHKAYNRSLYLLLCTEIKNIVAVKHLTTITFIASIRSI
jgi:hypothetical protein